MTIYIYIYIHIEDTIWTIAKELELPFIPPGARAFARGRGTLSPRAGRLPGGQKPSPKIPFLWQRNIYKPSPVMVGGGCPHSFELGELFSHIQLFVIFFCLFTTNIGALNQKKRACSSPKWPRILTAHLFSPGEIGRQPPALADAVDELGQLGSGAGEGGS